jgi:two-component system, cell cycle sensor histidine kinase and response regulator CckA
MPMPRRTGRILIVDDEAPLLRLVCECFGRRGWEIAGCASLVEAGERLLTSPVHFDVIVLDASLLADDLVQAVRQLLNANPEACVLLVSGYLIDLEGIYPESPERLSYLQKPFATQELEAAVRRTLGIEEDV